MTKVTKWTLITLLGYALYKACRPYAVNFRDSEAYGGECLMLLLPFYWAAVEEFVKDLGKIKKEKRINYHD